MYNIRNTIFLLASIIIVPLLHYYFFYTHHVWNRFSRTFWVFIAWRNLDSGFDACAYDGMTGYQYIWLTFGFVFHLLIIQALMIIWVANSSFYEAVWKKCLESTRHTIVFDPLSRGVDNFFIVRGELVLPHPLFTTPTHYCIATWRLCYE